MRYYNGGSGRKKYGTKRSYNKGDRRRKSLVLRRDERLQDEDCLGTKSLEKRIVVKLNIQ